MTVIGVERAGDGLEDDASAHNGQAASGEEATAPAPAQKVEDEPAKQKRNKKSKSNENPPQGAGFEAAETYDGAFLHIFIL